MILDELIAYVKLDDADRARLTELHATLAPSFPAIAERFYDAVWANPGAAQVLSGPDQVERLRCTLIDWMASGLLGPYDLAFNEKRARIGRVHVRIGLAQQYMFTSINVVRAAYLDEIRRLYTSEQALDYVRSVDKLFDVELALMLRHYQLDSEERLVTRERQILSDRITALQTMSAGLAHEVRNPLNAAKLQLELLERRLRKLADNAKLVEPVGLAHHEIQRLTEMLNEFLAFARPPDLHVEHHDAVTVVREVIELERVYAERTGVTLELAAPPSAVLAFDPGKFHQVVQNLVRNAIEAAPENGHVNVEVTLEDRVLRLRVSDDGAGMSDEVRTRMFEPFYSTKEGGTGMGMSIVHSFVAMHDGRIDVASDSRGTQIDVVLPRHRR